MATRAYQVVWYEILEAELQGEIFVRAYSRTLKTGEYDYVTSHQLGTRATRQLFERARAQGFRTVRPMN